MDNWIDSFVANLFIGLSGFEVALLFLIYTSAYLIKGVMGFGTLSTMVLLGALILPPHLAVVMATTVATLAQTQFIPQGIRDGDWKIAKKVILSFALSTALGIWVFGKMEGASLTVFLGITLTIIVTLEVTGSMSKLAQRLDFRSARMVHTFAIISGLVSGIGGSGGLILLAFYVKQLAPNARSIRGTMLLISMILSIWRLLMFAVNGFITIPVIVDTIVLLPLTLLCGFLGSHIFSKLEDKRFFLMFNFILMFAALLLLGKGVYLLYIEL